jgi:hypothetical protein
MVRNAGTAPLALFSRHGSDIFSTSDRVLHERFGRSDGAVAGHQHREIDVPDVDHFGLDLQIDDNVFRPGVPREGNGIVQ